MQEERSFPEIMKQLSPGWNFWTCCGIGGAAKAAILRCPKCGWEAEVSAWKPKACLRCEYPLDEKSPE